MVLAAGSGSRFGATKQLAELDGHPLVTRVVAAADAAASVDALCLVVGHDGEAVATAARGGGEVTVVTNPDHATGQASSLRAGIRAASAAGADVVVVLLADEPDLTSDAVDRVVAGLRGGALAARARYDDGTGHPVAFARDAFGRLLEVEGDRGAGGLLADLGVVEVPVAGPRPRDVDTTEDLAARRRG